MENKNEKTPSMSAGDGKKKRYYKKRRPKAVVANDVVKAEQGSSSSSPAASDTNSPAASDTTKPRKPRGKRAYGAPDNDQLGLPKIQTSVNGQTVEHTKTREAIDRALRISEDMVREQKDYRKESAAWDTGYTEGTYCGCGACEEDEPEERIDREQWDALMSRLERVHARLHEQRRVTVWDRIRAFGSGFLAYEKTLLLLLIALLESKLDHGGWAIAFGTAAAGNAIWTAWQQIRDARYTAWVKTLQDQGAEVYSNGHK